MALDLQDAVGRQYPLVARQKFTYEDFESGVAEKAIGLPGNARVIGGEVTITTAFDSGTSDTIKVGDGDDDDRYAAGVDAQAAARTALTLTGYNHEVPDTIDITWTGVGSAPAAGEGYLEVHYVLESRSNEVNPA